MTGRARTGVRRPIRLAVVGLGHIGGTVLHILDERADELQRGFGMSFSLVAVADHTAAMADPHRLETSAVLRLLADQGCLDPRTSAVGDADRVSVLLAAKPDVVVLATPLDTVSAQPGLGYARAFLEAGSNVVFADKGPLSLHFDEINAYRRQSHDHPRSAVRFSACVGGALPTIDTMRRTLAGHRLLQFDAVLNGTTQFVLRSMDTGSTFDEALATAQAQGIAEADPWLDLLGKDSACKLVIFANAALGRSAGLEDVSIGEAPPWEDAVARGRAEGKRLVQAASAVRNGTRYDLSVGYRLVNLDSPLGRLSRDEMGICFRTDLVDRLALSSAEPSAVPSASAVVRDLIDLYGDRHG